ncbi:aminotransferase [Photobacterium frigidiphilum]|uniref:cysteine-S-conjugate beta-lyase n=1 Tax=Photobacterium frigidiphilum TaxID=264736 RepID=A0A2T3J5W2_9GAMM|nr:MalY/PatB family protein [Photobacterium frigidiphilum]PSU42124.1 aminotransferase [Photobacterium frigidiphilum]
MKFSFDKVINRREVPALKHHPIVLGRDGENLFPAGVADMDFEAPPVVLEAIKKRLKHGVFGYETVPEGLLPSLIQWLHKRHNWQVEESTILRSPNILNTLAMSANIFTKKGDGIIVQPPVFFDFFDIIKENNRTLVTNPLILDNGRYRMDLDDLSQKAAEPRTKMLYLCNPHNPVGRVWSRAELKALGDICTKHDVLVVSDEIHGDITLPDHQYTPYASLGKKYAHNTITCLSPAKSFNLAANCSAFIVIDDEMKRKRFQAENSRLTVNKNNAFANVAMEAAWRDGESWLNEVLNYLVGNIDLVKQYLEHVPNVKLIEPEGTYLLWLDFRELDMMPEELTAFLRNKAGWAPSRGLAFGLEGAGFARMNIACPRKRLEEAMRALVVAVQVSEN